MTPGIRTIARKPLAALRRRRAATAVDTVLSSAALGNELATRALRPKAVAAYGEFRDSTGTATEPITGLDKPSKSIRREIVTFVDEIRDEISTILLPGENNRVKQAYADWLSLPPASITTAGLDPEVDERWDFEEKAPFSGPFDCIISQAMLEHLVDPYRHVRDLYDLCAQPGYVILHTPIAGFGYHRHPVDCVRLMPDWFEEVAERLGAAVDARFLDDARIMYRFRRA